MKLFLTVCATLIFSFSALTQHRGDYNWMFGYDYTDSLEGTEGTLIDFNKNPPTVSYQSIVPKKTLGNSTTVMSHPETGELLFYSNGCMVFDASHTTMKNGDDINPGLYRDYYCDETFSQWYPILGTLLSMEDSYNEDQYYFLHTPRQWTEVGDIYCDRLMYSYIDMTRNGGLGEVVEKNEIYYLGNEEIECGYTSVVKHANGKDWWILHLKEDSNEFLTFIVDASGPHLTEKQKIGPAKNYVGRATFDPSGTMLGVFSAVEGYSQYDFDRETGKLSNVKSIFFDENDIGGGLAYSASSEFVYLFYVDKIYQLETDQEDLMDGALLVDTLQYYDTGQVSSFYHGQIGPDCKIYITHLGGVGYLGVINNPDEKGTACNIDQRGLDLAYFHDIAAIPNFPPFRVDEEDKCDPTMTSIFPTEIRPRNTYITYYPNPVVDVVQIMSKRDCQFTITDAHGQLITKGNLNEKVEANVDLSALQDGVYFINVLVDGVILQSEKVVKI